MTAKARIRAVDRFIKGCREDGIYDDLNACCVMAGWDSLAGALTPLKGSAPTNNGFLATDYDRGGIGIAGDGSSHIDSNYAYPTALRNDCHIAAYISAKSTTGLLAGYGDGSANGSSLAMSATRLYQSSATFFSPPDTTTVAFRGVSRDNSSAYVSRAAKSNDTAVAASFAVTHLDLAVFARQRNTLTPDGVTDATLSFYSIGSSLGSDPATGLAALDARVSTLMADLRAIEEVGFDRDALAYIRAVEEADGAYLETDVKVAINNLVSGLKAESLWESMASTCLLCGPRTLAGALVPLRGDAPTAYGFVDGDHSRDTGLQGDGTSYLDSNRANDADPQNSNHNAVYVTSANTTANGSYISASLGSQGGANNIVSDVSNTRIFIRNRTDNVSLFNGAHTATGFLAVNRSDSSQYVARISGSETLVAQAAVGASADNLFVFSRNSSGSPNATTDATLAFYSIGSSIDLAKLDSHITAYVTAIGAAI